MKPLQHLPAFFSDCNDPLTVSSVFETGSSRKNSLEEFVFGALLGEPGAFVPERIRWFEEDEPRGEPLRSSLSPVIGYTTISSTIAGE